MEFILLLAADIKNHTHIVLQRMECKKSISSCRGQQPWPPQLQTALSDHPLNLHMQKNLTSA
jgi:hypothetical protein